MQRRTLKLEFVQAAIVAVCSLAGPALADPPPSVQQSICRPQFTIGNGVLSAGTAFVLDLDGPNPRTLFVSADHLFGPDGGLPAAIPWSDMAAKVTTIRCTALVGHAIWHGSAALTISGAHPMDSGYLRDVSAFRFDPASQGAYHLKLAKQSPKSGDSVWLLAQVVGGAPSSQLLHHAIVAYAGDDALQYRFDNPNLVIQATSGAPILNADGDVVGVNLGGGPVKGVMKGTADSLVSLRALLGSAK